MKPIVFKGIMALPLVLAVIGQNLANSNIGVLNLQGFAERSNVFISRETSSKLPYIIASRGDDDKKKCRWLGICYTEEN